MKIYTNETDLKALTQRVTQRLFDEGNDPNTVNSWLSRGVTVTDLNDYINNTGCDAVDEMLANSEVSYIVTELQSDDDVFAYVGVI
jgi:hypothetical protein